MAYRKYKELPSTVKKERVERLLQKAGQVKTRYLEKAVGQEISVVWEYCTQGYWEGYSDNYVRVYVEDKTEKEPTRVRVEELFKDGVLAVEIV